MSAFLTKSGLTKIVIVIILIASLFIGLILGLVFTTQPTAPTASPTPSPVSRNCRSAIESSNGGYVIAGEEAGSVYLMEIDSSGKVMWNRTFVAGEGHAVIQSSDGGYMITGRLYDDTGFSKCNLVKTDTSGNLQWKKAYGVEGIGYSVIQSFDGGYVIAGTSLIKTDASGDLQWEKPYKGNAVFQSSDGGYVITGAYGMDASLVKTDSSGNLLWNKTYGRRNYHDIGYSILQSSDDGYVMAGQTTYGGNGFSNPYLIKTDSSGNLEWEKTYGNISISDSYPRPGGYYGYSIVQSPDNCYVLAGFINSFDVGRCDFYVVKIGLSGNLIWNQNYGYETSFEIGKSVVNSPDGGYLIAGYTTTEDGNTAVYLVKTDKSGNIVWSKTC